MEKIEDIVEAVKFFPSRPGKLVVRLLRHPEPVLTFYTQSDPLTYGDVDITVEGVRPTGHKDLILMLNAVPLGQALHVVAWPRPDLQGWITKAEFVFCDLEDDVPIPAAPISTVELAAGEGSRWNMPAPSGSRLGKKKAEIPPDDPDSIHGTGTAK